MDCITTRYGKLAAPALMVCMAVLLCIAMFPGQAVADSRKDDIVGDRTVAESGLGASGVPSIDANRAYVVDSDGKVYFQRNAEEPANIASITKIMTAIVSMEHGDPDSKIVVSGHAASIGESTSGLKEGDVLDLGNALKGLMVPSGNDAAIALAENVGKTLMSSGGENPDADPSSVRESSSSAASSADSSTKADPSSMDAPKDVSASSDSSSSGESSASPANEPPKDAYTAFVNEMNATAERIGCKDTFFVNPDGLDDEDTEGRMHSTASDVAVMAQYAMSYPEFQAIASSGDTSIDVTRGGETVSIPLEATDLLLDDYEGACGIKTGFTEKAGYCFAGAATRDGRYLYSIVLDSSDEFQRFTDAATLLDWVYNSEVNVPYASSDQTVAMEESGQEVPVVGWIAHDDWIDKSFPVTVPDPDASIKASSIFGNVSQDIVIDKSSGSISAGDVVGHIDLYQHNELIGTQDLIACEGIAAPNIFDSISMWWQEVTGSADDQRIETDIVNRIAPISEKA